MEWRRPFLTKQHISGFPRQHKKSQEIAVFAHQTDHINLIQMNFRTFLFWTHLVVGVAAGLIILMMSPTGVILTYES